MSDMLEKAIIDAAALKEAAVRNAENLVLEKYSNQIKNAVSSLLEQEDPAAAMGAGPNPAEEGEAGEPPKVMEHIPLAVTTEDLDEEVEIPLEQLMKEVTKLSETMRFGGDFIDDPEVQENVLLEMDKVELEEMVGEDPNVPGLGAPEASFTEGYGLEEYDLEEGDVMDEEIVLDEADFEATLEEAIQEALIVDIDPLATRKGGWAGLPESTVRLAEEELLALEQDSVRREHRAEINNAVKKLQSVNEHLTTQNTQFRTVIEESHKQAARFSQAVLQLKEKLDEVNLANAKLLYQNKVLNSNSMNERQKKKLVESLSSASTIEEAKVIFETLEGTVGSTSRKKRPESLGEAVEKSSSMILSNRRREPVRQKESSPTYDRWKSLAGIKS